MASGLRRVSRAEVNHCQMPSRTISDSAAFRSFSGSSTTAKRAPMPVIEPPTPAARKNPPRLVPQSVAACESAASPTFGKKRGKARPVAISLRMLRLDVRANLTL